MTGFPRTRIGKKKIIREQIRFRYSAQVRRYRGNSRFSHAQAVPIIDGGFTLKRNYGQNNNTVCKPTSSIRADRSVDRIKYKQIIYGGTQSDCMTIRHGVGAPRMFLRRFLI